LQDSKLKSCVADHIWLPESPTERQDNNAGIHSWKNPLNAINYMMESLACHLLCTASGFDEACMGTIYNWGKIEEFDLGYESEFAYPKTVFIFDNPGMAQIIKNDYGCETQNIDVDVRNEILYLRNEIPDYKNCTSVVKLLKTYFYDKIVDKL